MQIEGIIRENWGFKTIEVLENYHPKGERIVLRIATESGVFIIKGIPVEVEEKIIISNTKAHEYLGNVKGIAPKILYAKDGCSYIKDETHYYYMMDYICGRQMEEKPEDELLLGEATHKLHGLKDYSIPCSFNIKEDRKRYRSWFSEKGFKEEYDRIIDALPDFDELDQCFIHTDIGPHNAMIDNEGAVKFIDLDDSGIGSKYLDLGWPFIMQFVDYNRSTGEMTYNFDAALAFLRGYYSEENLTYEELEMIWNGAVYMFISYMKCYGPEAVDTLWEILKFGIKMKQEVWGRFTRNAC